MMERDELREVIHDLRVAGTYFKFDLDNDIPDCELDELESISVEISQFVKTARRLGISNYAIITLVRARCRYVKRIGRG